MTRFSLIVSWLGALTACGIFSPDPSHAIIGRWQRVSETGMGEPDWLLSKFIEFRENGVIISLLHDLAPDEFWSTGTGEYRFGEQDQIYFAGNCWQSRQRYACTRLYRYSLDSDRLRISNESNTLRVEFKRVSAIEMQPPPTLAPPFPSPMPAAEI